ncbi:hypothetical protein [Nocardia xishanensis]|uniref:Uncharacterized protein n=1 Tax=Nocardia xishanensis TaxID=238964 RepID=A0ABW7XBL5_9NOCA
MFWWKPAGGAAAIPALVPHELSVVRHLSQGVAVVDVVEIGDGDQVASALSRRLTQRLFLAGPVFDSDAQRQRRTRLREPAIAEAGA